VLDRINLLVKCTQEECFHRTWSCAVARGGGDSGGPCGFHAAVMPTKRSFPVRSIERPFRVGYGLPHRAAVGHFRLLVRVAAPPDSCRVNWPGLLRIVQFLCIPYLNFTSFSARAWLLDFDARMEAIASSFALFISNSPA
jgi:hypothetical protein